MTTAKRFQIIHLGNPYDFVVKDHQTNKTYGTLQGDDKSLMELLNKLHEESKYWEQLAEGRLEQINQLKQKINTYNKVNELYKKENIQLKAQLSCKSTSVCILCKHHHLVKTDKEYYISKCKKEHEKCSKEDVKYCEDFEWSKKI